MELVKYVTVGMPIIVVPGKRDMEINLAEESETVWIPSSFTAKEPKLKELDQATVDLNNGIKPEDKIDKDSITKADKLMESPTHEEPAVKTEEIPDETEKHESASTSAAASSEVPGE